MDVPPLYTARDILAGFFWDPVARCWAHTKEIYLLLLTVILASVAVAIVQGSFFEWAFHRYWLHRPWLPKDCFTSHTLIHHQLCKFEDTFQVTDHEQEEAIHFQWWGGPVLVAINIAPWTLLSLGLWALGIQFPYVAMVATIGATILVYYVGYEGFHYLMHKPSIPFLEKSPPFRFLERHHRIHHVQMDRNLNVLIPLADLLLGTLVTTAAMPAHTPEGARKLARRHSKFGREMNSSQ